MSNPSPTRLAGTIVREQARRQVRTFLDELRNGTRNDRTVASLGGQVAQEYRGRAILELLQNAHDVLAVAAGDDPRRISFVLRSSPEPELPIANSGRPFRGIQGTDCRVAYARTPSYRSGSTLGGP